MTQGPFRIAILDDYQRIALRMADWKSLEGAQVHAFDDNLSVPLDLAARFQPFECLVLMRERTPIQRSLIEALGNLKLIVTAGSRNSAIDIAAATERRIQVCGTDMLPYPTAELAWGLILALARRIPTEDAALRRGRWQTSIGVGLKGKVMGIVGLGRLGRQVVTVARAFGMEVLAWSQNLTAERAVDAGATLVSKSDLFARADVVSIHLVLSERTRGLIGASELGRMKPSAFLINTSRGPIVEESALLSALERGGIAGAALDVFGQEPLAPDHPFVRLPNTVLTPHLGYVTEENYRLLYGQAVEAIAAYRRGQPIRKLNEL